MISKLDQTDPNWRIDKIESHRSPVDPAENSAVLIASVGKELAEERALRKRPWGADLDWPYDPRVSRDIQETLVHAWVKADVIERLAPKLEEDSRILNELLRLTEKPSGRCPELPKDDVDSKKIKHLNLVMLVDLLLTGDAILNANQREVEHAIASAHAILNSARSIGDEPRRLSQFIRANEPSEPVESSNRLLRTERPRSTNSPSFSRFSSETLPNRRVCSQKGSGANAAVLNALFERLESDGNQSGDVYSIAHEIMPARKWRWTSRIELRWRLPDVLIAHAAFLETASRCIEAAELDEADYGSRLENILYNPTVEQESPPLDQTHEKVIANKFLESIRSIADKRGTAAAEEACSIAALASERFWFEHKRWPESLEELVPEYLQKIPIDPYSGNTIRLRHIAQVLIPYSVGVKRRDDQGITRLVRMIDPSAFRLAESAHRGADDIGFILEAHELRNPYPSLSELEE